MGDPSEPQPKPASITAAYERGERAVHPEVTTIPVYRSAAPLVYLAAGAAILLVIVAATFLSGPQALVPVPIVVFICGRSAWGYPLSITPRGNGLVVRYLGHTSEFPRGSVGELSGGRLGSFARLDVGEAEIPLYAGLTGRPLRGLREWLEALDRSR